MFLVSLENISGVNFVFHVFEAGIIAVGDDGLGHLLEGVEVVDNLAAEEGLSICQSWLVNDDCCAFGFDALHDALDGTLTEVVAVALHREPIHANYTFLLH